MQKALFFLAAMVFAKFSPAAEIQIAVAANFTAPMQQIAAQFEKDTGHKALLSFGATGKFYSQIANGAPFDVLLAADDETPARLEKAGLGMTGQRFTYAIGRLVLWSADPALVDGRGDILRNGNFKHLAIANPKTAPYGAAAIQTLNKLGLFNLLRQRFVQGENIAQTHQFIASGNAELGFVALSQVVKDGSLTAGSTWTVPADLHDPIRQDAQLLVHGKDKPLAAAFLAYLRNDKARTIIRAFGYELP